MAKIQVEQGFTKAEAGKLVLVDKLIELVSADTKVFAWKRSVDITEPIAKAIIVGIKRRTRLDTESFGLDTK